MFHRMSMLINISYAKYRLRYFDKTNLTHFYLHFMLSSENHKILILKIKYYQ